MERPITVDELRPFFVGHEVVLELALTRFHLAHERAAREDPDGEPVDD